MFREHVNLSKNPLIFSIIAAFLASILLLSEPAEAVRGYKERDYIIERSIREKGVTPRPGARYTLSLNDSEWPEQVTFSMKKAISFLVEIEPVKGPAGVVLLGSRAYSPHTLNAFWAHDDLRSSTRLRTGDYFRPEAGCSYSGCPAIRFQATGGTVAVTILEVKKSSSAYTR